MVTVMLPKLLTWPWGRLGRDVWGRPVWTLPGVGQWEDAYLSAHFPRRKCLRTMQLNEQLACIKQHVFVLSYIPAFSLCLSSGLRRYSITLLLQIDLVICRFKQNIWTVYMQYIIQDEKYSNG